MLLDHFMPQWDFYERHQVIVAADRQGVYQGARHVDLNKSPIIKWLLRLRELPHRLVNRDFSSPGFGATWDELADMGFTFLAEEPPDEFVFGLIGVFWGANGETVAFEPGQFTGYQKEGHAKVAANFLVEPLENGECRLSTETRIICIGQEAKKKFGRYWRVIGPFSGWTRKEMLRLAKKQAQSQA